MADLTGRIVLQIDCDEESIVSETDQSLIERVVQEALRAERGLIPAAAEMYVSLVLVGDKTIARLNQEHRGVEAPTDVLSFPQHDRLSEAMVPAGVPLLLGDIVVSLPRAEAQAAEYGHSRDRELAFLVVHGLLHLLGYNHETPEEADEMQKRQEVTLRPLGLFRGL